MSTPACVTGFRKWHKCTMRTPFTERHDRGVRGVQKDKLHYDNFSDVQTNICDSSLYLSPPWLYLATDHAVHWHVSQGPGYLRARNCSRFKPPIGKRHLGKLADSRKRPQIGIFWGKLNHCHLHQTGKQLWQWWPHLPFFSSASQGKSL